jgi:hypothetical protein
VQVSKHRSCVSQAIISLEVYKLQKQNFERKLAKLNEAFEFNQSRQAFKDSIKL